MKPGKTGWASSTRPIASCLGAEIIQNPLNYWNRLERKFFDFESCRKGQIFVQMKLDEFADFDSKQL